MSDEKLVPVFMPALVALLVNTEDKIGLPLTDAEVRCIRDEAAVIMLPKSAAEKMAESRGYHDIDPQNYWYDWQMVRREMGREPELDAGARFAFLNSKDSDIENAVLAARHSLGQFRELIGENVNSRSGLVKVKLDEPGYSAYMWLIVTQASDTVFTAELFELPREFKTFKVGDAFTLRDEDIFDWMVNDDGTLYGGLSLRLQREKLTEAERPAFDHHIGVQQYA